MYVHIPLLLYLCMYACMYVCMYVCIIIIIIIEAVLYITPSRYNTQEHSQPQPRSNNVVTLVKQCGNLGQTMW